MYEEDQQTVLSMYAELFNDAADETEFSAFLVSPTRQAVALARTYNSKERKLQINSTSRADNMYDDDDDGETPAFIQVIERLRENAERRGLLSGKRSKSSVWSDTDEYTREAPFTPVTHERAKPETKSEAPVYGSEPAEQTPRVREREAERVDEVEMSQVEPDEAELTFDDFSFFENGKKDDAKAEDESASELSREFGRNGYGRRRERNEEREPERKVIVPLAVLYAIIAIPVTVLAACIILIPTFASLGASALCLYAGFKVTLGAFAGFSMFSDIMVVLGSGVIILALGLLFLWLFIWFIGGAIAGLINAVIQLGGKWCSKEVR